MKYIFRDKNYLLIFFILILFVYNLGAHSYFHSEGRYIEIPRNMVESHDYITPRLNGVKYFEKPPLMYWAGALSYKFFGNNEWAHRFWPALFGLLTILASYHIAILFKSKKEAYIVSCMMATSLLFYVCAKYVVLDMPVSALIALSLYSFLLSTRCFFSKQKQLFFNLSFFLFLSLAVLTKGLIGLFLPYLIIFVWIFFSKKYAFLKNAFQPWGIFLFSMITLPWHILVSIRNPEFFNFYFIHEHFLRYLTTVHHRNKVFFYYIYFLNLGLFPWFFYIIESVIQNFKKIINDEVESFFFLWFLLILIFFSFSSSKLIPYILPAIPPLLLLGAFNIQHTKFKFSAYLNIIYSIILLLGLPIYAYKNNLLHEMFVYLSIFELLFVSLIFISIQNLNRFPFQQLLFITSIFIFLSSTIIYKFQYGSLKPLVHTIQQNKNNHNIVIAYKKYYQDLPVYMNQRIYVIEARNELDFGMQQEDTSSWMITKKNFPIWIKKIKDGYIVLDKNLMNELNRLLPYTRLKKIDETKENLLLRFEN